MLKYVVLLLSFWCYTELVIKLLDVTVTRYTPQTPLLFRVIYRCEEEFFLPKFSKKMVSLLYCRV